jgi:hypothetical protein
MTLQLVNKNLDSTPRVLGIDIGLSGAISTARLLAVEDMPTLTVGSAKRRTINPRT